MDNSNDEAEEALRSVSIDTNAKKNFGRFVQTFD